MCVDDDAKVKAKERNYALLCDLCAILNVRQMKARQCRPLVPEVWNLGKSAEDSYGPNSSGKRFRLCPYWGVPEKGESS